MSSAQSVSTVKVEIELWYRRDAITRRCGRRRTWSKSSRDGGGRILDRSQIADIGYHALLAELPIQQVHCRSRSRRGALSGC